MIDTVRVSEKGKTQLITLKRRTGIQNWNVLCRWALCISLNEKKEPPNEEIPSDSSIEMTWKTFTGGDEELYLALLKQRAFNAGLKNGRDELNKYFRLHLHRGISYMTSNNKLVKIEDLIRISTN
jgi:DNA sulfur modification protein DndE